MYKTLQEAIEAYLNKKGFGSMTKNDFEVFIFNCLLQDARYSGYKDFDFSIALRIPESKVKRLRYEANLKYPQENKGDYFKQSVESVLKYARFVPDSYRCIEIGVEDFLLRKSIEAKLKKANIYTDYATNSEILKLTLDDYEVLLKELYGEEQVTEAINRIKKEKEKETKKNNSIDWKDLLKSVLAGLANGASVVITDLTLRGLLSLLFH